MDNWRRPGDPGPIYGPGDGLFSVELHHRGFFCGIRENRTYIDDKVDFFDNCVADTWSMLWMADFLDLVGINIVGTSATLYWCLPGISTGVGLKTLKSDADFVDMINAAATNKTVKVFVNHVNLLVRQNEDDTLMYGHIEPPKVISPRKGQGQIKENEREDHYIEESDSESDSDFHDSDYEVDRGDDDLYNENVDEVGDDEFRDDEKMSLKSFATKVRKEFNMVPKRWKLGRARKAALTIIHGDEEAQFTQLWDFGQELRRIGLDPNDCILPIAMGMVEVESTSSWEWFLTNLKNDLNIINTGPYTIMSDRQKNFHKKHKGETLKNNLWAIARSTNVPAWDKNMEKMKTDNPSAFDWVEELAPNTWVKAFFNDFPKCDLLLNNHCEVFNRRWQFSGIPCGHALACCRDDRLDPEDLVHSCYIVETYLKAYGSYVVPLRSKEHWEKMSGIVVHPPLYTKTIGRPKKNRKKDPSEKDGKLTKHGVTMHCSICKSADHNKNGHKNHIARASQPEGPGDGLFSVELHHRGFFCGIRENRTYIDDKVDFFDNCVADTWSMLWMADFLDLVGINIVGTSATLYWCLPGISTGVGLKPLKSDAYFVDMINAAATNKTVKVFVDHVNLLVRKNEDDALMYGHIEPPKVISPRKWQRAAKRKYTCDEGTSCDAANIEEEDEYIVDEREDHYREESDSESDSDFHDSDYEVDKGDDDLYNENVDEVGDGEKEAVAEEVEEVDALDDPQLDMPCESRQKIGYKFKTFEPDFDMNNPVFKLGMKFSNVKELRNALASYTVRNRVKIVKTRNTASILNARCDGKLVGLDPNDCIFPIAMGLVEVESTSSWEWFLTNLKNDLNIINTRPYTIMSDKQKGLIKAVQKIWPDAEHRHCVRHFYQNFHKKHKGETLKNNLWAIARSTNVLAWDKNMEKMKTDNPSAFDWVEELAPNTWVKAFFNDFPKCDLLLNNHCEVFNSYILDARELPIMTMLHKILCQIMQRALGEDEWHFCASPLYTKTIGRPKKNRKKDPSEKDGKLTKHGVTMHCSICKSADHNKNGHKNHIAHASQPEGVGQEEFDDPTILAEVMPHDGIFHTDPSEMPDSMVYNLLHEERGSRIPEGSLPEESHFVVENREHIPPCRVTTAVSREMATFNIGRGRSTKETAARGRGRATGRGMELRLIKDSLVGAGELLLIKDSLVGEEDQQRQEELLLIKNQLAGAEEQQDQGALLVLVLAWAGEQQDHVKGSILELGVHITLFLVMMVHTIKILMKLCPHKMHLLGSRYILVQCNFFILCQNATLSKSDRNGFYAATLWINANHPPTLVGNLRTFAKFGCFKDLLEIVCRVLHDPGDEHKEENEPPPRWPQWPEAELTRRCDDRPSEALEAGHHVPP
ncbi:hypothetical protein ACQ4PT_064317 [Festuca glaucescens]